MGPKIIIPIILMALIASVSLFKVEQWEQAIVFKFREIDRSDYKPGLHFKIPGVNTSQTFEARLLNLDPF
jgi:membrane protease subunit HflC